MAFRPSSVNVRGFKVSARSNRRFMVVAVRPEPYHVPADVAMGREAHTYIAFARALKRSDSYAVAKKARDKYGLVWGAFAVIIDLTTGEEI